jgi:hypothetical protein
MNQASVASFVYRLDSVVDLAYSGSCEPGEFSKAARVDNALRGLRGASGTMSPQGCLSQSELGSREGRAMIGGASSATRRRLAPTTGCSTACRNRDSLMGEPMISAVTSATECPFPTTIQEVS